MRSRTATSSSLYIVHCRYCASLANANCCSIHLLPKPYLKVNSNKNLINSTIVWSSWPGACTRRRKRNLGAEQNGGSKKPTKQQNFSTGFYSLPVRISYSRSTTVWICFSLLDWRNTDNVQYRVDSWQFAISPRSTRLRIDYG